MSDYISREAALADFEQCNRKNSTWTPQRVKTLLMRIPAADVEPVRRGRWISWEDADNCIPSPNRHECSVCHDAAQVLVNNIELLSNYCPNCGAKMDLEDENNDD